MNRTMLKTGSYAVMHFTVAIIVAYALTQDWRVALAVGIVEPLVQTLAFAVHEKLWAVRPSRRRPAAIVPLDAAGGDQVSAKSAVTPTARSSHGKENGAPGTIRTSDPQIRSLMLYPAELRARMAFRRGGVT